MGEWERKGSDIASTQRLPYYSGLGCGREVSAPHTRPLKRTLQ